jgi:hypothetical protein
VEGEPVILGVFNPVHAWRQRRARRRAEQQPAPPEPDEPPSSAEA